MKRCAWPLVMLFAALAALGLLVVGLGLVPVGASSGHLAATSWFLHFTMRQSVQTRALGIEAPALDDMTLVVRGAGHFDSGCAPCHGAPGVAQSKIALQTMPPPPELEPLIHEWQPRELFWIVKHGVKYTGMPAWVAQQRDDEVWAVVAFLLRLPELTPDEYRKLAHGEHAEHEHGNAGETKAGETQGSHSSGADLRALQAPSEALLDSCSRCHHRDGSGRGDGAFPRLADQSETYLFTALRAFAEGTRFSGIMQPLVAGLDESAMRDLARHYASQEEVPVAQQQNFTGPALRRGAEIASHGIPERGIPSCIHCHGPSQAPHNPFYPVLAGQYAAYLIQQLELFHEDKRGGGPFRRIMNAVAHRLEPDQIRDVAAYYAALPPVAANASPDHH